MDWFSSLPTEMLTKIMSFMSTEEAVQTCVLSQTWTNAWTFLPVLKINVADYRVDGSFEADKFNNFLSGMLEKCNPIELELIVYDNDIQDSDLESRESIDRKAVIAVVRDGEDLRDLPNFVFNCTRLENLNLCMETGDAFPIISRPELVHLPALKSVELTGLALSDDDSFILNLCSNPVLETMVLKWCDLGITKISSRVLQKLTIYLCSQSRRTQISCPSLASLVIESHDKMKGFELEEMTSLEYAEIILDLDNNHGDLNLLTSLSNVSHLSLGLLPSFKVKLEKDISDYSTIFRKLRTLEIKFWSLRFDIDLVACFLKLSSNLEELTFHLYEIISPDMVVGDPKEEISQEELGNRIEYLKTLRIVKPISRPAMVVDTLIDKLQPAMVVDRLIDKLRTHIKEIGEEIVI